MGLYVWYFGTKGTADKWADVGHHTIVNGPRFKGLLHDIFMKGKLSDDMSLYVIALGDRSTAAPEGDDTFYVLSPVPHLGWDNAVDWQVEEPIYRAKVAAEIEKIMPGFQDHIVTRNGVHARDVSRSVSKPAWLWVFARAADFTKRLVPAA